MLKFVRACLRQRQQSYEEIAQAAGVGSRWLRYLDEGVIARPGLDMIERLAFYFDYDPAPTKKR